MVRASNWRAFVLCFDFCEKRMNRAVLGEDALRAVIARDAHNIRAGCLAKLFQDLRCDAFLFDAYNLDGCSRSSIHSLVKMAGGGDHW